jgi:hypothetical protein
LIQIGTAIENLAETIPDFEALTKCRDYFYLGS